jgi:hypothetical protein
MSWTSFHRRGDVLRAVLAAADARRDGALPMDVAGVRETFGDELALLGALSLRWHTRLAGHIEHEVMAHPSDAEEAVLGAWRATAAELPGVRAVLDHHRAAPLDDAMADAMATATRKERVLLAVMAGQAGPQDPAAPRTGERLESRARAGLEPVSRPGAGPRGHAADAPSLLERLKAALAA